MEDLLCGRGGDARRSTAYPTLFLTSSDFHKAQHTQKEKEGGRGRREGEDLHPLKTFLSFGDSENLLIKSNTVFLFDFHCLLNSTHP